MTARTRRTRRRTIAPTRRSLAAASPATDRVPTATSTGCGRRARAAKSAAHGIAIFNEHTEYDGFRPNPPSSTLLRRILISNHISYD